MGSKPVATNDTPFCHVTLKLLLQVVHEGSMFGSKEESQHFLLQGQGINKTQIV